MMLAALCNRRWLGALVCVLMMASVLAGCDARTEWLYRQGLEAMEQGDHQKARRLFVQVSEGAPDHPRAAAAALHRARIMWTRSRHNYAAEIAYTDVIRNYPQTEQAKLARLDLIQLYREDPQTRAKSMAAAEQFLRLYPNAPESPDISLKLADMFVAEGQFTQAVLELEQQRSRMEPGKQRNRLGYKLAQILLYDDDYSRLFLEIQSLLDEIAQYGPQHLEADVLLLRAIALEEMGEIEQALEVLFEIEKTYSNPRAISEKIVALQERLQRRNR